MSMTQAPFEKRTRSSADAQREVAAKRPYITRFSGSERALHWANAVPYLVLLASGAALLVHRLKGGTWLDEALVSQIHCVAGIALMALVFLALWGGHWPTFRQLARDLFKIEGHDVKWAAATLCNLIGIKRPLPAIGRFNLGQKTNAIVQLVSVTGLAITGTLMLLYPGILSTWWAHLAFFALGFPWLLVHLYMALIHKSTRHAMKGITEGRVTRSWAEHHHALWVREVERSRCPSCGSHDVRRRPHRHTHHH
ncbi:MAG: cytochrome b/b6 domain-containing protein [Planctomycetes bacterium]|nr:cytochrome b/b6 domain-containing protein [Planctomycetota bacterium]